MFIRKQHSRNHDASRHAPKPPKDAHMPFTTGLNQEQHFKKKNILKEREKIKKLMDDNDYHRTQVLMHQKASNIHAEMQRISSYHDKNHIPTLRYQTRMVQLNQEMTGLKEDLNKLSYSTLVGQVAGNSKSIV